MDIFSNNHRLLKASLALLMIFILGLYSHMYCAENNLLVFWPAIRDPGQDHFALVCIKVGALKQEGLIIRDRGITVFARGHFKGVKKGDIISIVGRKTGDRNITMIRYHIHKGRNLKIIISLAAFMVLLGVTLRCLGFDRSRWSIIEKNNFF